MAGVFEIDDRRFTGKAGTDEPLGRGRVHHPVVAGEYGQAGQVGQFLQPTEFLHQVEHAGIDGTGHERIAGMPAGFGIVGVDGEHRFHAVDRE